MRLGVVAAIVFIVLGFGILFGSMENRPLIDSTTQARLDVLMNAEKVSQEGGFGVDSIVTLVKAPFLYFDAMIGTARAAFDNPLFTAGGGWSIIPYFTVSPIMIVLIFGLVILLLGVLSKVLA